MASSEMKAAINLWYLQALATNTGLNFSGQQYTVFREARDMWLLLGKRALFCPNANK